MATESRPESDYTRTWPPSGDVEFAALADGTRLRYLKAGSGRTIVWRARWSWRSPPRLSR